MAKTPIKMQEVFDQHIAYEIAVFADTYRVLTGGLAIHASEEADKIIGDALKVAFCIHGKTLMEFLSKSSGGSYAASEDYADNYLPWKIEHGTKAHALRGKLNNQLSHLTYDRTDLDADKIGDQDRKELVGLIHSELVRWIAAFKTPYDRNKFDLRALATAAPKFIKDRLGPSDTPVALVCRLRPALKNGNEMVLRLLGFG